VKYLSVCSGIEAASVAWHPLGWTPVAFSEIEAFPSAVLAHHYPGVPNLGDMTEMDVEPLGDIDILVGGTPCQAFSVAGLRQSLDDARGNLTLSYVRLIHELVEHHGLRNAVWENVPGVLSTKDNAFGCFLGAIVGSDQPLVPSRMPADGKSDAYWRWNKKLGRHVIKWPSSGMVSGPKGRAAWTVKDAQYFGLAQRRRRVFVISDFGSGADPAAVLFEREGVPGNPAPRRESRKDIAPTISARPTGGGGLGTDFDLDGGLIAGAVPDVSPAMKARDYKGVSSDGDGDGLPIVPMFSAQTVALRGSEGGATAELGGEAATALRASTGGGDKPHVLTAVSVTGDISHTFKAEGFDASEDGTGRGNPIIAFSSKDYGADAGELSPTLRAGGHNTSHANAGIPPAIAWNARQDDFAPGEIATPLDTDPGTVGVFHQSAVRRLTPVECERLQGFPDDYTRIPMPKKGKKVGPVWAADGPRYKALGNSMAVPVMRWIGERIDRFMPREEVAAPVVAKKLRFTAGGRMVFE
jgi:DNA (cytosine-5)-methyltransferase 1